MIIPINEANTTVKQYWTEMLVSCLRKLYETELNVEFSFNEPMFLVLSLAVKIPDEAKDFSLFDSHTFDNGISFKNYHVAVSMLEILATPKIRSDLIRVINRSNNMFNDLAEHFYVTKQLFLSCGFVVNIDRRVA